MSVIMNKKKTPAELSAMEAEGYITLRQMAKGVKKFDDAPEGQSFKPPFMRASPKPDSAKEVYGITVRKKKRKR